MVVGRQERWTGSGPGEGGETEAAELVEVLRDWEKDDLLVTWEDYQNLAEALGDES